MNLLSVNNELGSRKMVLLAPADSQIGHRLDHIEYSSARHDKLLAEMQRLRGAVYLQDGAISPSQLTVDGRHRLPVDDRSWHVLSLDANGKVSGCSRYLVHPDNVKYSQLELVKSAIATSSKMGSLLRSAVEGEMALARSAGLAYVEVGGWALSAALRCTTEALRIALATYSLAELLGGCIGISTVTVRNHSSSVLKRIGGGLLRVGDEVLPRYYDPSYDCDMEILRFDSRSPNARFRRWIETIRMAMVDVPVICAASPAWRPVRMPMPAVYAGSMGSQPFPLSA